MKRIRLSRNLFVFFAAASVCAFNGACVSDNAENADAPKTSQSAAATPDSLSYPAKGSVKLVAIADLFPDRLKLAMDKFAMYQAKFDSCKGNFDIPESRQYAGWDAYKQLIDQADVDVVINATPPVFRPLHLRAAVEAGKHIFVEKPACVDPVQARELFEIADLADKKGLTIIPGVQRRFHPGYMEAIKRLQDGQIGEIVAVQAYWLNSRFFIQDGGKLRLQNPDPMQIEYQIRNWFIFRWTSGDCYVEQHVHNLDVVRWALGKDPVEVNGIGGRRWDIPYPQYGDRFSHFGVDFDFGNGLHCASYSRREQKSKDYVLERFVGTKGILETNENNMQRITGAKPWEAPKGLPHALIEEHRVLIDSVLNNKKINMLTDGLSRSRNCRSLRRNGSSACTTSIPSRFRVNTN